MSVPHFCRKSILVLSAFMFILQLKGITQEQPRPNIIYIVSDDQGYGDFSWTGNPYLKTPNLDKLKSESVTLERFYTAPLCAPSRAAIMTGRYQYRTGIWDTFRGRSNMASDEKTTGEYLKEIGYTTGLFGKWHLGVNYPFRPDEQGFDSTYVEAGDDRFHPIFFKNGQITQPINRFLDDAVTDKAIEFISNNRKRPFFASINLYMPHSHYNKQIGEEYVELFRNFPDLTTKQREVYAMLANLDMNVGRIVKALAKAGLEKNTLIIFHSDNGAQGERFNAGLKGQKGSAYEGGIRVPCFVKWKGKLKPFSRSEPFAVQDILPTICEITGINNIQKTFDGKSFWPALVNPNLQLAERYLFQQQQPQQSGYDPQLFVNSCLVGNRYKLVYMNGEDQPELYDLIEDKGEQINLAYKLPEVLMSFKAKYKEIFQDISTDRGFGPLETIVGNKKGGSTVIGFGHFHPENGFPVFVERPGNYLIRFTGILTDLFPNGGALGFKFGKEIYKTSLVNGSAAVELKVDLPKGSSVIFPYNEGILPKRAVYGGPELGFRYMIIETIPD